MNNNIDKTREEMRDNIDRLTQMITHKKRLAKENPDKAEMNEYEIEMDTITEQIELTTEKIRQQEDICLDRR